MKLFSLIRKSLSLNFSQKNGVFDCLAITSVISDVIDYGNIAILCYLKFKLIRVLVIIS